ncbi:MAG: heavy-metal-associated domain-containing protein [Mangrovicoccus sp.]|nr:heavy-metal-associated domain-containing protein [Mangrovicoccus sp.]
MAAFHVPDMTCGHCVATIRKALENALPGAATEIELAEHLVRVEGDAATARQALVEAGYTPEALA